MSHATGPTLEAAALGTRATRGIAIALVDRGSRPRLTSVCGLATCSHGDVYSFELKRNGGYVVRVETCVAVSLLPCPLTVCHLCGYGVATADQGSGMVRAGFAWWLDTGTDRGVCVVFAGAR